MTRSMFHALCLTGVSALCITVPSACSEEPADPTQPSDALSVEKPSDAEQPSEAIIDIAAGESLVTNLCSQCHGDKIIPFVQSYPNIKGQKANYILKQLREFKTDKRQDLYMQSVVKSLSDQDMQNVAAFYSTLEPLDLYDKSKDYRQADKESSDSRQDK
ncbi:cytochrome c [Vibrio coralliilyticus]|uniref:c-type cytochrome n=1 Tax=Vibrio coralliilyticus TaxID=190893 RepID=UPI0005128CC2|nr:cytochrome c [Vibrio coralliilyticus]AIS57842.1 cytochrome C [Vibrio coralliilyticus]